MHIIIFGFRAFKQLSRHLCHVRGSFPMDCLSQSSLRSRRKKGEGVGEEEKNGGVEEGRERLLQKPLLLHLGLLF